jgi:hypothetical protein
MNLKASLQNRNLKGIPGLAGIVFALFTGFPLSGQQSAAVSMINLGVPSGIGTTFSQITLKSAEVRVWRVKPATNSNKEEYEIFPIEFIDPTTGDFNTANPLLEKMQVVVGGKRVAKAKVPAELQQMKISGLITFNNSNPDLAYFGELLFTPYGYTYILHEGCVTLSSIKAITKGNWLGAIYEARVNSNETIVFSRLEQRSTTTKYVEMTVAGSGALLKISDGSIIGTEGPFARVTLPVEPKRQLDIKTTLDGPLITVTYPDRHDNTISLTYNWSMQQIDGNNKGKLKLIESK